MGSDSVSPTTPCTLCIIKPHVLKSGTTGGVLRAISNAGFTIAGVSSFHMSQEIAEEFLGVYHQVYRPYSAMLEHICSSSVLAVLVSGGPHVVEDFRSLVGPLNPELAKILRPTSIRALFGKDLAMNAVHCTDLAEDGEMECRYMFETVGNL